MINLIYKVYYCMPRWIQSLVSRIVYKPKLGKGVNLYGWPVFSALISSISNKLLQSSIFLDMRGGGGANGNK